MNKEKFMQFLSKVIDTQANISITVHQIQSNKEAEKMAFELSEIIGGVVKHEENANHKWVSTKNEHINIHFFSKESYQRNKSEESML